MSTGFQIPSPSGTEPVVVTGLAAHALDAPALTAQVHRPDCGGVVVFEGTVRSPNEGHAVLALEYEAWEDPASEQIERFAREAAERHGLGAVLAVHRTGRVEVGEPAVVVAASSVHRDAAFEATAELIDRIKREAWIWKKELRVDGDHWVEGCGHPAERR